MAGNGRGCIVSTEQFGLAEQSTPDEGPNIDPTDRSAFIDVVIAGYEDVLARIGHANAPEFLDIDITMAQAKLLYILATSGDLRMSELVGRLGVSLPTISGLVDRVVDAGLAARHPNPADRRQVVVGLTPAGADLIDQFRELNARQMRSLLQVMDEADLAHVRTFLDVLQRSVARLASDAATHQPIPQHKDPA